MHEEVIQNRACEGTQKSFHEEIMIMHTKARRILREEIIYEETMQNHVCEKHEDQISNLPTKYTKIYVYVNKS